jgi:hypothetical protein
MKRLIAAFLAGAMVHAASSRAATCICPPEAVDPAWAVNRATVVFLGSVQQTTPDRKVVNAIGQSQTQYVATFTVERQWQGSDVEKIDVVTVRGGFCWPNFEVGKQYVVFAFKGDPGKSPYETAGSFYARACYPSEEAGASRRTIQVLDDWSRRQ